MEKEKNTIDGGISRRDQDGMCRRYGHEIDKSADVRSPTIRGNTYGSLDTDTDKRDWTIQGDPTLESEVTPG